MIRAAVRHSLPVMLLASAGLAQTQWNNASGGQWNQAANWDPMDVPDMPDEAASIDLAGTYTVTLGSLNPSLLGLSITNPNATLGVNGGSTIGLGGALFNDGLIVLDINNSTASAVLDVLVDLPFDGAGILELNQIGARSQIISSTGATATNGTTHTIRGRGRIHAALVNNGLVSADRSNTALELRDGDKTNNGLMLATDNGFLDLFAVTVNQGASGIVRADNGTVRVQSGDPSAIAGGTLETLNGGVLLVVSGSELQLTDPSLNGSIDINGGGVVRAYGSVFSNDGLIRVDANNSTAAAILDFVDPVLLTGSGSISMMQIGLRSQITTSTGETVTNGAGHTIAGRGRIHASLLNEGTIRSDISNTALELRDADKTNNALIEAVGGAFLDLVTVTVHQGPAGVVRADDGTVRVQGSSVATINNGTLESDNGGVFEVESTGVLMLHDVTLDGALDIEGGGTAQVTGASLANEGLIRVDSNNSTAAATLDFLDSVTVSGGGAIQMMQIGLRSQITTSTGSTVTLGADQTIMGRGRIHASLVNNGQILANVSNTALELRDAGKVNNALIEARDSGILDLVSGTLTQSATGVLRADDGVVRVAGSSTPLVVGGAIESINSGDVRVTSGGVLSLDGVDNRDTINVNGGGELFAVGGGFTNNGHLEINANNSTAAASLIFTESGTIDGLGRISLPGIVTRSVLTTVDGAVGTIGVNQRVTGTGTLDGELRMDGSLEPGNDAVGEMRLLGMLEMLPGGRFTAELGSTSSFDELIGAGIFRAGGTLSITNVNGAYDPEFGDSFVIVDAAGGVSGEFAAVTGPTLPGDLEWRVRYDPTQAVLLVTCDADANLDGEVNTLDVLGFLNLWTAGDPKADVNSDGSINTLDVLAFLNAWTSGC